MPGGTPSKDVKTRGLVLRRTNYGEADRVLNIITPEGKMAVMAKGVRKSKSRLAGAVEMFTLSELVVHFGRGEMGTLTSARMVRHYGEIVKDLARLELASEILKRVNLVSENVDDTREYFRITEQSLEALNDGVDMEMVEAWVVLNIRRVMGEELNLYRDTAGDKLKADAKYYWNSMEGAFELNEQGSYGADEIKLLRLMQVTELKTVRRVKCDKKTMREVVELARIV